MLDTYSRQLHVDHHLLPFRQPRLRHPQDRPALELIDPRAEGLVGPLQHPHLPPPRVELPYQGSVGEVPLDAAGSTG